MLVFLHWTWTLFLIHINMQWKTLPPKSINKYSPSFLCPSILHLYFSYQLYYFIIYLLYKVSGYELDNWDSFFRKISGCLFLRVKQPEQEADHSYPCNANIWNVFFTSMSLSFFMHCNNFTFTLSTIISTYIHLQVQHQKWMHP